MNLRFRPQFDETWTHACIRGGAESAASNILTARLLSLDYEVEIDDEIDGWIAAEDYDAEA